MLHRKEHPPECLFCVCELCAHVLSPCFVSGCEFCTSILPLLIHTVEFLLPCVLSCVVLEYAFSIILNASLITYVGRALMLCHSGPSCSFSDPLHRWLPCWDTSCRMWVCLHLKMAEGNNNEEVIHLNSFHCHRGQGKLFILTFSCRLLLFHLILLAISSLKWTHYALIRIQRRWVFRCRHHKRTCQTRIVSGDNYMQHEWNGRITYLHRLTN